MWIAVNDFVFSKHKAILTQMLIYLAVDLKHILTGQPVRHRIIVAAVVTNRRINRQAILLAGHIIFKTVPRCDVNNSCAVRCCNVLGANDHISVLVRWILFHKRMLIPQPFKFTASNSFFADFVLSLFQARCLNRRSDALGNQY